jgi:hypothetical protein
LTIIPVLEEGITSSPVYIPLEQRNQLTSFVARDANNMCQASLEPVSGT